MVIIGIVVYHGKNIVALEHLDGLVEGTVFLGHRNYREEKKGGGGMECTRNGRKRTLRSGELTDERGSTAGHEVNKIVFRDALSHA